MILRFQVISGNALCLMIVVKVRVWSTPGTVDQTQYALETAVNALAKYQQYFNIPYPLPKLDLIAIPGNTLCSMR
jgi:aminopeptidase N